MSDEDLFAACGRLFMLIDRTEDAIERRDLEELGLLDEQLGGWSAEMQGILPAALAHAPDASLPLVPSIRKALHSVTLNQIRLAGWLSQAGGH